ncbi:Uncharacterised protein [Burkholderia pseudomallei]|nr:Uncharacterised protein [Burkholderia pseudomallei]CAJ9720769.1 Uncharacterised protein [Burkholderia pseudomallei]
MVDEIEEALVEHAGRNGFARDLDHRVVARADRQRQRAEHAQPDARRRVALLQRIAVLHRVHVRDARCAVDVRLRADDVKLDDDVRIVARLEVLAAVDRVRARRARHVALAQQRAARGFARRGRFFVERARVGARGRVELFLLIKRLGRRRTGGQHGRHRNGGQGGKRSESVRHGVIQRGRPRAARSGGGSCAGSTRPARPAGRRGSRGRTGAAARVAFAHVAWADEVAWRAGYYSFSGCAAA